MSRDECYDKLTEIALNQELAERALVALIAIARDHPRMLRDKKLTSQNLGLVQAEFHDLFFVRMFASFETSLRSFWRSSIKPTEPRMKVLLESVASRRMIPQDVLDKVNLVRKFRNRLMHEDQTEVDTQQMSDAGKSLRRFLAWLPLDW